MGVNGRLLQFGYYGVNNWMPSYLESELGMKFKEMTAYMVGTYTAMILGKVLAGMMADKLGRRFTYAFGAIGTAIFLPLIVFYNSPSNILYLLVTFGFLYGIPYGVNATYMTESFATAIRGTAIGGAYNVGRLGAALACNDWFLSLWRLNWFRFCRHGRCLPDLWCDTSPIH